MKLKRLVYEASFCEMEAPVFFETPDGTRYQVNSVEIKKVKNKGNKNGENCFLRFVLKGE